MSHLLPHKIISFLLQEFPLLSPSSSSLCVKPSFLLFFDQSSPAPSSSTDHHHPHHILLVLFSRSKSSSPRLTELHFFLSASPWSVAITSRFPLINQRSSRDFSVEARRNNSPLCDCLRPLDQSPLRLFRALLGRTNSTTSPFLSPSGSRFQHGHLSSPLSVLINCCYGDHSSRSRCW